MMNKRTEHCNNTPTDANCKDDFEKVLFGEIKQWLFYEEKDDYATAVGKLKTIVKQELGGSNYLILERFFRAVLIDNTYDTIVALSRRAHLMTKIFLPIIYNDHADKRDELSKIRIITDKGLVLNQGDIQEKKVAIVDETAIFGRTLELYNEKVRKIGPRTELTLWACMVRYGMPSFENSTVDKNNKFLFKTEDGKEIKISYTIQLGLKEQKDLLYKILRVIYAVGIPFTAILPVFALNKDETKEFETAMEKACDKYLSVKRIFANTEYRLFYENSNISAENQTGCFRLIKNKTTEKSFLLPAVLQPSLAVSELEKLFPEGKFPHLDLTLPKESTDEINKEINKYKNEIIYRLSAYFLKDYYLRKILQDNKISYQYFYTGLKEHLNEAVCKNIEDLHKSENEASLNDIITQCINVAAKDISNKSEIKIEKLYREFTKEFCEYIAKPNNWDEITNDFADENNIYALNAFTAYILRLSTVEDCDHKMTPAKERKGYDHLSYFIDELYRSLDESKIDKKYSKNKIFAIIVYYLDFGVLTMNSQDDSNEVENDYCFGVVLRPGEQGNLIPKIVAQAYDYYSDVDYYLDWEKDKTKRNYNDFFRGLLVGNVLKYLESVPLVRLNHLYKVLDVVLPNSENNSNAD
ncbi:MAG: hypothetical protein LBU51_00340, partial [Bacteroidales bacterium]|nr:hypothetical protein [Bacteroidales bacterium]